MKGTVRRARLLGGWVAMVGLVALVIGGTVPGRAHAEDLATAPLPRPEVLDRALDAYHRVAHAGLCRTTLLAVIDYSLPSSERRLWVLDLVQPLRVLFHEYVAHGRGSTTDDDPDRAIRFGNEEASLRSSLGTFLTGPTYQGQHGRSLELFGLEPGVNDKAFERRIVMHPADYMSAAFRAQHGRVGRSFGCPALDPAIASAVIDRIRDGSVIYVSGGAPAQFADAAAAAR
jgi:hypothetical protein